MLDTGFERLPGDIGNAATWRFPVQYGIVRNVTGRQILSDRAGDTLETFVQAANDLVELGVDGITTSCGFLALLQPQLAARCAVPVMTSSLQQIPMVQQLLRPGQRIGILTADRDALTPAHFVAIGCSSDHPIVGMSPTSRFRQNLLQDAPIVAHDDHRHEALRMAQELMSAHEGIGAIVCECTNLAPYSHAIASTFGIPVFDIVSMVEWFHSGLRPARYGASAKDISGL
jgi:Asp/Glu/hydantoin racemase